LLHTKPFQILNIKKKYSHFYIHVTHSLWVTDVVTAEFVTTKLSNLNWLHCHICKEFNSERTVSVPGARVTENWNLCPLVS
jgi:hypothetical protein